MDHYSIVRLFILCLSFVPQDPYILFVYSKCRDQTVFICIKHLFWMFWSFKEKCKSNSLQQDGSKERPQHKSTVDILEFIPNYLYLKVNFLVSENLL